jgi:hypothetical protein
MALISILGNAVYCLAIAATAAAIVYQLFAILCLVRFRPRAVAPPGAMGAVAPMPRAHRLRLV